MANVKEDSPGEDLPASLANWSENEMENQDELKQAEETKGGKKTGGKERKDKDGMNQGNWN